MPLLVWIYGLLIMAIGTLRPLSCLPTNHILSQSSEYMSLPIPSLDFGAGVWSDFRFLLDAEKGFISETIAQLQLYFVHFGYLSVAEGMIVTGEFDSATEDAVKLYQERFGLPVTGILDIFTLFKLMQPRCGREDFVNGLPLKTQTNRSDSIQSSREKHFTHFPGDPKWSSRSNITYAFSVKNETTKVSEVQRNAAFASAFAQWSAWVPLNFTEVESFEKADVKISFVNYEHGDGDPFDGVLGILAHAFAPEDGRFHLDDAEFWTVDVDTDISLQAIDLQSVVLHEIGHLIGLGHSWVEDSIMYPSIPPRVVKHQLSNDDIEGAQALYGATQNDNLRNVPLLSPATNEQLHHSGTCRIAVNAVSLLLLYSFVLPLHLLVFLSRR